jgi:hypothetical protein
MSLQNTAPYNSIKDLLSQTFVFKRKDDILHGKFNTMKGNYASLKATMLSFVLLFGLEYFLISITNDNAPCFWHNTILGNMAAWSIRIICFTIFTSVFLQFFLPSYKTLRERMLDRDEENERERKLKEKEVMLEKYILKQAR